MRAYEPTTYPFEPWRLPEPHEADGWWWPAIYGARAGEDKTYPPNPTVLEPSAMFLTIGERQHICEVAVAAPEMFRLLEEIVETGKVEFGKVFDLVTKVRLGNAATDVRGR